ncbi:MAG: PhoU domain-containing protein [Phycisphaerales bacterium]
MTDFDTRLSRLHADLVSQGSRVLDLVLRAVESYFDLDAVKAAEVIASDDVVDKVDVEIERASIPLLAMGVTDEYSIRSVLTIVKVNNELERIADLGVTIAEVVAKYAKLEERTPTTFRVMANSVIGMLRDANRALADGNAALARQVLLFDDTVSRFKEEILLDAQEKVASGRLTVHFAFRLMTVTKTLERIADHCTNMAEQVIYLQSGKIVRHRPEGWSDPETV